MVRRDEPNEFGFAGEATAPEPAPRRRPDEKDAAEELAIPDDDLTTELSEALEDIRKGRLGRPDQGDSAAEPG